MANEDVKTLKELKGLFSGCTKVVSVEEMNAAIERAGASANSHDMSSVPLTRDSDQTIAERVQRDPEFSMAIREGIAALTQSGEADAAGLQQQVIHTGQSSPDQLGPVYELDDGPLSDTDVEALRKDVEKHLPRGKLISKESLFK